jgi:hypothetical protein
LALSVVAGSGIGTVVSEGVDRTVATLIAIIIIITPAIPSSDFRTMCNQLFQGFVHGRDIIIMYITTTETRSGSNGETWGMNYLSLYPSSGWKKIQKNIPKIRSFNNEF